MKRGLIPKGFASPRIPAACIAFVGLLSAAVLAQNPDSSRTWNPVDRIIVPDTGRAVTADEVIAFALKRSRRFQSLSTNVEIAEHRLTSSGGLPNRNCVGQVSTRSYDENFDEMRLGLRIRFPDLGEMAEEKEQARTDLGEQKVEKIRYEQELAARVRRDFADVLAADRLAELAKKKVDLLDRRIGMIEHLIQTGDRSIVYYMKAKTIRAEAWNDYSREVQKQGAARRQLVKRTGLGLNAPFAEDPPASVELEQAVRSRPSTVRRRIRWRNRTRRKQRNAEWFKLLPVQFHRSLYHCEEPGLTTG
jgi:outer membrane protein TolC